MNKLSPLFSAFLCLFFIGNIDAQDLEDQKIQGEVYKVSRRLPFKDKEYIPEMVMDSFYTLIQSYTIDVINRDFRQGFPAIKGIKTWFGIDYKTTFGIKKAGWYTFLLQSDDGSRLLIDEQKVVENGGMHKMRSRRDTIFLERGNHKLQLLYFQAMPMMLGLRLLIAPEGKDFEIFDIRQYPLIEEQETLKLYTLSDTLLFTFNEYELAESAKEPLKALIKEINTIEGNWNIKITGHTDSDGEEAYNLILSQKRAEAVKQFMEEYSLRAIQIFTTGKGESEPIFPNLNAENKAKNRRVEIKVIRKN